MMNHGKGFFHSAIDALKLLFHNPLRTFIIIKIDGFIIVIGIFASSLLSILFSFITIHLDFIGDKEYSSPVHVFYWQLIILVYFIIAFAVSYMFLNILNYLVYVIFMCFLQEMSSSGKREYRTFGSNDLIANMSRVVVDYEMKKNESQSKRVEPVIVDQ
ncbi:MAG: hypothetical protein EZS28_002093 [Streblomastix strix]|uniref:Choline transporter-like protein n=1 Tax=Streblomastix strix TaxID=222440 RepID=A0A5J4X6U7_9EUKA|nr:MAG: hypothetical protein EZS28_002093 [Streblomastix strix]